jgi:hypothetical protein
MGSRPFRKPSQQEIEDQDPKVVFEGFEHPTKPPTALIPNHYEEYMRRAKAGDPRRPGGGPRHTQVIDHGHEHGGEVIFNGSVIEDKVITSEMLVNMALADQQAEAREEAEAYHDLQWRLDFRNRPPAQEIQGEVFDYRQPAPRLKPPAPSPTHGPVDLAPRFGKWTWASLAFGLALIVAVLVRWALS